MSRRDELRAAAHRIAPVMLCAVFAIASPGAPAAVVAAPPAPPHPVLQSRPEHWTGDFDALLARRMVRILVPYSPTLFYHDHGRARGIVAEAAIELETYLNKRYPDKRPFTVVPIPTTRDRLLQGLVDGDGDVAAGSLTITAARRERFDFTTPTFTDVDQIFVSGPDAPPLRSIEDLAGKTVAVRRSKSFYDNLVALNLRFENPSPSQTRLAPMTLELLPDELESEDVLEMVNAGLVQIAVCEDWLANIWSQYLRNVRVHSDLVLSKSTELGWAMRKGSPKLEAVLDDFIAKKHASDFFDVLMRQAADNAQRLHDATGKAELKRFEATIELFRQYGQRYDFDFLMLAAQGYQESRLEQNVKSPSGAVGIMQVMPATGTAMRVGDIHQIDPNIHAGTKYLAHLMDDYFKDAKFDEQNRALFAFASYNAGPGNITKVRARAMQEGVNPDVWFNEVEHVAARMLGQETVRYVRNVFKYYVAYKLAQQTESERAQAIETMKSADHEADDDS